ncbi:MAG TPA: hypothetical protein VNA25_20525 [Phycisphaerae bacterium]|nr:hypothetical protein [Phycisphaerae bacterium]
MVDTSESPGFILIGSFAASSAWNWFLIPLSQATSCLAGGFSIEPLRMSGRFSSVIFRFS